MEDGGQMLRRRVALNSDSIQEDADAIAAGLETRQRTILQLRDYAKMADSLHMKSGQETMTSSGVGIAGGLMTVGSGVATILTAGAAAPMLVGALALGGTATSVGAAGLSVWNTVDSTKMEADLKQKIEKVLAEDNEAVQRLQDVLARLSVEDNVHNNGVEIALIAREVQIFVLLFNCGSSFLGSATTWELLAVGLPLVSAYTTGATAASVGILTSVLPKVTSSLAEASKGIEEVVDDIAKETVSSISEGATKEFVKKSTSVAANEAYKEALKAASKEMSEEAAEKTLREAAKKTAKEVAKKAGKEAYKKALESASKEVGEEMVEKTVKEAAKKIAVEASKKASKEAYKEAMKIASKEITEEAVEKAAKEAAKKAATEAAKKAAQEAAEEASKEALKTAGKITGGITAGLGAASVLWDGYNFYRAYEKTNTSSDLGCELRRMADFFENQLNNMINPDDD